MRDSRSHIKKPTKILLFKIFAFLFAAFLFLMPDNMSVVPDMDMRVLVTTLGIGLKDDKIEAIAQMMIPVTSGGSGAQQQVADGAGSSVADALNNLSLSLGRKIELKLCEMVIVGPEISASDRLVPSLTYLLSSGSISPGASLVFSDEYPVREFMVNANDLGEPSGMGLNNFVLYSKEGTHVSSTTLLFFLSNLESESSAGLMPCVSIEKAQKGSGASQQGKPSGGGSSDAGGGGGAESGGGSAEPKVKIKSADTVAVFKDGKLAKKLESYQSKGVTWLDAYSKMGLVQLEKFNYNGEDYEPVPAQLKNKKFKLETRFVNGLPVLHCRVKAYLQLSDKHILDTRPGKNNEIQSALTEAFAEKIRGELVESFAAAKELDVDFLGVKKQFHRYNLKQLRDYENTENSDFLRDLTVEYEVSCFVK